MFDFDENSKIVFDEYDDNARFVQDKVCLRCNMTLSEFLARGIVGCADCYKVFEAEVRNMVLQKQGSINHVGKISSKHFSKIKIKEKIEELEKQKDIAAEKEDYILAESLKNQMTLLV